MNISSCELRKYPQYSELFTCLSPGLKVHPAIHRNHIELLGQIQRYVCDLLVLEAKCMRVFQHDGPVIIGGRYWKGIVSNPKAPGIVIDQVEVIAFPGIVTEPEVSYKHFVGRIKLYKGAGR